MTPVYAVSGLLGTRREFGMKRWQKLVAGLVDMATLVFYMTMVLRNNGLMEFARSLLLSFWLIFVLLVRTPVRDWSGK